MVKPSRRHLTLRPSLQALVLVVGVHAAGCPIPTVTLDDGGPPPGCGNGVLEPGEQCDDANVAEGDGCSPACAFEQDQDPPPPSPDAGPPPPADAGPPPPPPDSGPTPPVCGNGVLEPGEQCEDGNAVSGDGCSSTCAFDQPDAGPPPPPPDAGPPPPPPDAGPPPPDAGPPAPVCGNGVLEAGEQCDDGNTTSGDGCSAACANEPPPPVCGNGQVQAGEQCDDGNTTSGDGCSATCAIETPPPPVCGNDILEAGEECDDGNTNNNDQCSSTCEVIVVAPDCSNFTYGNYVYNCEDVDRCTLDPTDAADLRTIIACSQCDPIYADPPLNCGPVPFVYPEASSCMRCHNGSDHEDYAGIGLSNPHPFGVEGNAIGCADCHGGNPNANGKNEAHVYPPPQIGNRNNLLIDPKAYFNYLTRAGLDTFGAWTSPGGRQWTAKDYIRFMNPGDLRVVAEGEGCGSCHYDHSVSMANASPIGTETGFFSNSMYLAGATNAVTENQGLYEDTAADYSWRGTRNTANNFNAANPYGVGEVGRTIAVPEHAGYDGPWRNNPDLNVANLENDVYNVDVVATDPPAYTNRVRAGSDLAKLYQTQISITCGDCHAGSAGANNRYADFRSSGCTACHMTYSMDGRTRSTDPNVNRYEPFDPDAIAAPERPHVEAHQISNVARLLPNGAFIRGIEDKTCVGCHQGSNRTVLQYWGIRLDQNQDLENNVQYPANPATFVNTANDTRLYDPTVLKQGVVQGNDTFNGRAATQYILEEDYDNDGRDDTPADIHYEKGMGCIDCHGSRDVHAGTEPNPLVPGSGDFNGRVFSRMDQVVQIRCESCHGTLDAYAPTVPCKDYDGATKDCLVDAAGNAQRHTWKDVNGKFWLKSRLNGQVHPVVQVRNIVNPNSVDYNSVASYAMGRVNGDNADGIGPKQVNPVLTGANFSHLDNMDCISCHASWQNNCIGCHLRTRYDDQNYFFSNLTGERILMKQENADFTYINPIPMYLGVGSKNKITQMSAGQKTFYAYIDQAGNTSQTFMFSDRNGDGNNPNYLGRNAHPAGNMYQMMSHTIRGRVTAQNEGARYCVACHNTVDGVANFQTQYDEFVTAYANRDYANFDFNLLQQHIGQNTGNTLNSPIWVHMVAGLGSGMFLFDEFGCPVNPLDPDANRKICDNGAPADNFNANNVAYDADRLVELTGKSNVASAHPLIEGEGIELRDGSQNRNMAGPLGETIINKLTNLNVAAGGKVLDSWFDADGQPQGDIANATGNLIQ